MSLRRRARCDICKGKVHGRRHLCEACARRFQAEVELRDRLASLVHEDAEDPEIG